MKSDESGIDQTTHEAREEQGHAFIVKLDLMVQITLEEPHELSKEQPIIPVVSQEGPIVEVNHIDFIFGEHQWKFEGCDLMVQILHSIIQSGTPPKSEPTSATILSLQFWLK